MRQALDRFFGIASAGSTIPREVIGGLTTFMTMAYIAMVNPAILQAAFVGADADAATTATMVRAMICATCVASAIGTLMMGLIARYPIAIAPGMGMNAFFTFTVSLGMGVPWRIALGIVFIAGVVFLLLSLIKVREMIITAIPESLKMAAAAGIGVFIAFIGLKHAGVIVANGATLVSLGDVTSKPVWVAIVGLAITAILHARRIRGAILMGIIATAVLAYATGLVAPHKEIIAKPSLAGVFGQLDIVGALHWKYISAIVVLLFFAMFDTVGTLMGVATQAGFVRNGTIPRATKALSADAASIVAGAIVGTSTTTSYIESAAGVADGARTGLANVVTAAMFIVAMFFAPLAEMFGHGLPITYTVVIAGQAVNFTDMLYPVTAPALIIVGCMMMGSVRQIAWDDWSEALPAFLTIVLMPLTFSISAGLFSGLVAYPLVKFAAGRVREVHGLLVALVLIFLAAFGWYQWHGM